MLDTIKDFTSNLGLEIIKSSLQETHDLAKIKNDLTAFVQNRQAISLNENGSFSEIDFSDYLAYIREDMLDDIKEYVCTVDYAKAERIKQSILAKASIYEKKRYHSNGSISYITENCINIIRTYYEGKLDGEYLLLAHITVQSIVKNVNQNTNENITAVKALLKEQDNSQQELISKIDSIHDMLADPLTAPSESNNTIVFYLAYCRTSITYAQKLMEWLERNGIVYESCCYEDDYSLSETVVRHLTENQILILLVDESFMQNIRCISGLFEAATRQNSAEQIMPVIMDRSIFRPENRLSQTLYWEEKEKNLRTNIKRTDRIQHVHSLVSDTLIMYELAAQSIDDLNVWFNSHHYTSTDLKKAIKKKLNLTVSSKEGNNYFYRLFCQASTRQYETMTKPGNKFHKLNVVKELFPDASIYDFDFSGVDEIHIKMNLLDFIKFYPIQHLMFVGEGGMGKTTTMFHILKSYYKGSNEFTQVPLYIELNKCPSQLKSWCFDDKTSVFIEKCVAELLKGLKHVDKKDDFIKEIQFEFQKEPINGQPQYLILLDGLNEVTAENANGYSVRSILEAEISNALHRYKNVRFIITSRSDSRQIHGIKKITLSGVSEEGIETYLKDEEKNGGIKKGTAKQVMKNKELLACLKIPLFLNMFGVSSENTATTTRGEILRDFFQKKRRSLYSDRIESNKIHGFLLDFIIPAIAWEMVSNDIFSISLETLQQIVKNVLTNKKTSIPLSEMSQICFKTMDLNESPQNLCHLLRSKYFKNKSIDSLLDIIVNALAIIYVDNGECKFKHHHFRDYFAAVHIINEIKLSVQLTHEYPYTEGAYLDDLKNYRLSKHTLQFISESLGLHHSNPQYLPAHGWILRRSTDSSNIIFELLNIFRNRFNGDIGWVLWNIVHLFNASGMGLLGIDLSDLDLRKINFNGILCGIDKNHPEIAAKFDNSLINLNYFLPISHAETITGVTYSNNGEHILTMSQSKLILWNSKYDYVNKIEVDEKIKKSIFNSSSNYVVSITDDSKLIIWNLWKDEVTVTDHTPDPICDICPGPTNNTIYVAFSDETIVRFNIKSCTWNNRIFRVRKPINQLMFNEKYKQLVIKTENGEVIFGNELTGVFCELPFSKVKHISQTHNGEALGIVTLDDFVQIGDLHSKKLINIPSIGNKKISKIQLSSDGNFIALALEDNTLKIYDLKRHTFLVPLQCSSYISSITFSLDNRYVITTSNELFAKVWEIKSDVGVCIRPLGDMADWIRNAYYSPDGQHVATSSIDSTGKIWDVSKGQLTKILYGHSDRVTSISYNHSGTQVVTTS